MIVNDQRLVGDEVEYTRSLGVYSYRAVYDKVTERYWFIMQFPNDPQYYYWKHIDGADL